jgi:ABC-type transport system involved in multi-copper enzyme maturation permease subunit
MSAATPALEYQRPVPLHGLALVASQTWALTIDSFRQLQSRKLFWITLLLSTLVAASFATVGVNERGLKILWFDEIGGEIFNSTIISPAAFYKLIFLNLGIGIWLAWAAIILALVSTAGMIPELISDGSIDLYLSKPLGRVRLLLTKYFLGLMFVALQTVCFTLAAFLVIGIRGGVWETGLFWTVPLVTLLYSFLFSIAALVGLTTGSTVAAILVTLLVWLLVIFSVDAADQGILNQLKGLEVRRENAQRSVELNERLMQRFASLPEEQKSQSAGYQTAQAGLEKARTEISSADSSLGKWRTAHWWVMAIKAPLPKTSETMAVLQRKLIASAELDAFRDEMTRMQADQAAERARSRNRDEQEARQRVEQSTQAAEEFESSYVSRSAWWSLGTSVAFEAVLLAIACWIFVRRDF